MKGDKKTVLSPSRCLILCAAAAVAAMLLLSAAVELANVLARPLGVSLLSVNFPVSALISCGRAAGRKARSRAQAAQGRQRPLRLTALRGVPPLFSPSPHKKETYT